MEEEETGSHIEWHKYGSWGRVRKWNETIGDRLCVSCPDVSLPPPPFSHQSLRADFTAPRQRLGGWCHGWLSYSWRLEGWQCHSCGEIEHCHWPAAMWVRSHRPRWWRCTPCKVTLGWEGGREGCWVLWHSCSLWAIHSASGNKRE